MMVVQVGGDEAANGAGWRCSTIPADQHRPCTSHSSKAALHCEQSPANVSYLQVELAITVDAGTPFVRAPYNLEGDGPLVLKCYEEISRLSAAVTQA